VLGHSWHPTAGPPTWGNVVCSHPLHRGGYAVVHALGGGVFGRSVCARVLGYWSFLVECCGEMVTKF
jgi:hypothetical protein